MGVVQLNKEICELIDEKYNVLEYIQLVRGVDVNYLINILTKYHSYEFASNERIVILHHDTDYYSNLCLSTELVGNSVYNFFRLCANFNISLGNLLFVTNHYDIEKEMQTLAKNICNSDSVTVIQTSQWTDYPSNKILNQAALSTDQCDIDSLYVCLNHRQRFHRLLTLCMLAEYNLLDQGIITYHFKDNKCITDH